MVLHKGKKRKVSACLAVMLATAILGGCGDDHEVTVPAVSYDEVKEILGVERIETEETQEDTQQDTQQETQTENDETQENPGSESATGENDSSEQETDAQCESDMQQETAEIQEETGETLAESESQTEMSGETVTITISAAGDTSLGNHHMQDYYFSFQQAYDQNGAEYFLDNVADIFAQDDMTILNLEGTLTDSETQQSDRTYNIKGDPEYVEILTGGSVEAVSLGNNHRYDYGEVGSKDTNTTLKNAGIIYAYDENLGIYETKGIRIGFVSVSEASRGKAVESTFEEGIALLKEQDVDLILACCHWGSELEYSPEEYQRTLGKKCIDWGADLVIGHHPHVLQGIEEYQGKYIVYSLGNFCFGANRNPDDKDTMIFQQTFTFVDGEKQEDKNIRVIPCSVSSVTERNDFRPTPAEGEEAGRIIDKINGFSKEYGVAFDEEGYLLGK